MPLTRAKVSRGRIRMRMSAGSIAFIACGGLIVGYMLAKGEGWFWWLMGKNRDTYSGPTIHFDPHLILYLSLNENVKQVSFIALFKPE